MATNGYKRLKTALLQKTVELIRIDSKNKINNKTRE